MKRTVLFLAALCAAGLSTARARNESPEALASGARNLSLPQLSRIEPFGQPWRGSIDGSFNGAPVNLILDRRAWGLTGNIGQNGVNIGIDNTNGVITGTDGSMAVNLFVDWLPNVIRLSGTAGKSDYNAVIHVISGQMSGTAMGSPLQVSFSMDGGIISGSNTGPIALNYDVTSGSVNGIINGMPIDVTLTDMDISDFMEHLYLFLAPQS
ncbi:MAG: hypothetical protein ACYCPQ_02310 [Elusimicrobiota bacterium]